MSGMSAAEPSFQSHTRRTAQSGRVFRFAESPIVGIRRRVRVARRRRSCPIRGPPAQYIDMTNEEQSLRDQIARQLGRMLGDLQRLQGEGGGLQLGDYIEPIIEKAKLFAPARDDPSS